jgi:hypothetical protein
MRHAFPGLRLSIAAKLCLQVALSVGLVAALAGGDGAPVFARGMKVTFLTGSGLYF